MTDSEILSQIPINIYACVWEWGSLLIMIFIGEYTQILKKHISHLRNYVN